MSLAPSPPEIRRIPDLLAELAAVLGRWYPDHAFALVGTHRSGDGRLDCRIPCPAPATEPAPQPEDGTNSDLILTVLDEADRPLTVVELAYRAVAGEPTGAFRKAIKKLARDGRIVEHAGPPKTYEPA